MASLSASALGELRALCAKASQDPSILLAPELRELAQLIRKLGGVVPEPAPAAAPAPSAPGNDDLRDEECVDEPDVATQEMGPASADEEPSDAVRRPSKSQRWRGVTASVASRTGRLHCDAARALRRCPQCGGRQSNGRNALTNLALTRGRPSRLPPTPRARLPKRPRQATGRRRS